MTRISFLQLFTAVLFAPFIRSKETEIMRLEEDFCRASNRLADYREKMGFIPGVRVQCVMRHSSPKFGVIADYGKRWYDVRASEVPILYDDGGYQRWWISDLLIQPS